MPAEVTAIAVATWLLASMVFLPTGAVAETAPEHTLAVDDRGAEGDTDGEVIDESGAPAGETADSDDAVTMDNLEASVEHPFPSPEPEPIVASGTLVLTIADPGVLTFDDGRRFYDRLELVPDAASVLMINDLTMDDYIAGLAEMPTRWPMEALKAQAVAARTYAWRTLRSDRYPGYDICATVACQVFRGAGVVLDSSTGERWREAVRATSNEVLLDDQGQPILARYFSTSGGRTYANEDVFPSSGSFPYLLAIDDPYDEASPLHTWTARFTREQFDEILARGATLSAVVPIASVERMGEITDQQAMIRVTSTTGVTAQVGAVAFRDFVSRMAAEMYPNEYPGPTDDGEGTLPAAMPSSRFSVEVRDDEVVVNGRGWGHGVGMGQFGAFGRAEDGATYEEILATYYGGLMPQDAADVPERIRVGMTLSMPRQVIGDGVFSLAVGDLDVAATMGTWSIDRVDGAWSLIPPRGHDQPLEGSPTRLVEGYGTASAATVEVAVNKPVALTMEILDIGRDLVLDRYLGIVDHGVHAFTWEFDDASGSAVPPGDYLVMVRGVDLEGAQFGTPVPVNVPEPPPPPAPPVAVEPEDDTESGWMFPSVHPAVLVGLLGFVLILAAVAYRDRS
ncbi:MAG: SpoIID/LytB domain-containing protein [Nitriliruptoraceae bacterium]